MTRATAKFFRALCGLAVLAAGPVLMFAQQPQAMCRETLEAWVRDKSLNAKWNSDHTAVIMVRGGVEYICTCPSQTRPPVCKPAGPASASRAEVKSSPPPPPPAAARPIGSPPPSSFAREKEELLLELQASGFIEPDFEKSKEDLLASLDEGAPAGRAEVTAAIGELAVMSRPPWRRWGRTSPGGRSRPIPTWPPSSGPSKARPRRRWPRDSTASRSATCCCCVNRTICYRSTSTRPAGSSSSTRRPRRRCVPGPPIRSCASGRSGRQALLGQHARPGDPDQDRGPGPRRIRVAGHGCRPAAFGFRRGQALGGVSGAGHQEPEGVREKGRQLGRHNGLRPLRRRRNGLFGDLPLGPHEGRPRHPGDTLGAQEICRRRRFRAANFYTDTKNFLVTPLELLRIQDPQ